jgi:hypothetical protein
MIRCTLELLRGGIDDPSQNVHLGTIEIANDIFSTLRSDGKRGSYKFEIHKKRLGRIFHIGKVENFPRLSYHPWNLVRQILNDVADAHGGRI